jgi:hypothetical protein
MTKDAPPESPGQSAARVTEPLVLMLNWKSPV